MSASIRKHPHNSVYVCKLANRTHIVCMHQISFHQKMSKTTPNLDLLKHVGVGIAVLIGLKCGLHHAIPPLMSATATVVSGVGSIMHPIMGTRTSHQHIELAA